MSGLKAEAQPVEPTRSHGRRLDIQGLRAVAVLLVVANHARLPVPGGFVGVDVFFVISGFVITGMIHRERSTGRFGFGRFYLRRFKRLTPALALMVAVTMVLSFCLLSPFGSQQTAAQTGIGAMLLVANFVIARNTGGYLNSPAESNPLLHTWSLSVEEQFYLVFPAILVLGWVLSERGGRRWARATLLAGTVALISFGLAAIGADRLAPGGADWFLGFYSPFTRAWEFAVGALLAIATTSRSLRSDKLAHALAWLGVALLAGSALLTNSTTPFPGPWTLLPVGGTLLVIAAGTHHTTQASRALARPAVVKVGDWSYSIYLWHWPLVVFAVHLWPDVGFALLGAATLSFLPAVASYRWVEDPLRRLAPMTRPRTLALVAAVVSPAILLAATVGLAADRYWLPRYKSGAVPITHQGDTGWTDWDAYLRKTYHPCTHQAIRDAALKWKGISNCHQSKPGSRIDVAVVGDSHAEAFFLGLADVSPDKNIVYYSSRGVPIRFATGYYDRVIEAVASDPTIKTVILTSLWAVHGVPIDGLVDTFQAFTSRSKAVFVTDDVPVFQYFDPVGCKYRVAPILPFPKCSENRHVFDAAYAQYYPKLRAAVDRVPGVQLLYTAKYFCDNYVCSMNKGDILLYRDSNHVNNVGSRFLVNHMLADYAAFRTAMTRP